MTLASDRILLIVSKIENDPDSKHLVLNGQNYSVKVCEYDSWTFIL